VNRPCDLRCKDLHLPSTLVFCVLKKESRKSSSFFGREVFSGVYFLRVLSYSLTHSSFHLQFKELSEGMSDVVFIKVDVDENPDS
jgi:hypothetical protein